MCFNLLVVWWLSWKVVFLDFCLLTSWNVLVNVWLVDLSCLMLNLMIVLICLCVSLEKLFNFLI